MVEPFCHGYEHASFNAALLAAVAFAYPDASLEFAGEPNHVQKTRMVLLAQDESISKRIVWQDLEIPARAERPSIRVFQELRLFQRQIARASTARADLLLVSTLLNTGVIALKLALAGRKCTFPILAVLHSVLASLIQPVPRRPIGWLLHLRHGLRLPHPQPLRYLVLGEPIRREAACLLPRLSRQFCAIDPPYFWERDHQSIRPSEFRLKLPIRFGFIGVANQQKQFDLFARLAHEVQGMLPNAVFTLAGYFDHQTDLAKFGYQFPDASSQPLPRQELASRISNLSYVIGTSSPAHYRLAASASFLDSLSFVKPGVFLRNPYIEYYMSRVGDIGYLCDSYEELKAQIIEITGSPPHEQYQQQCENILARRHRFAPISVARQIQVLLDGQTP